jgi:hypothetical protein
MGIRLARLATGVALVAALVGLAAAGAALPARNLLQNPGAERFVGGQLPGWTLKDGFTALPYGADGGFPTVADGRKLGGGKYFFTGGVTARSTATQVVGVSGQATAIDGGSAVATLSGLVGGYASQADWARVTATFLGASGKVLGAVRIGPVTPAQRNEATTLLARSASAKVPAGTRSIAVVIVAVRASGSWADGNVDNLSLTLRAG